MDGLGIAPSSAQGSVFLVIIKPPWMEVPASTPHDGFERSVVHSSLMGRPAKRERKFRTGGDSRAERQNGMVHAGVACGVVAASIVIAI